MKTVRISRYAGSAKDWPWGPCVMEHWQRWRGISWFPNKKHVYWIALRSAKFFPLTRDQFRRADRDATRVEGDTLLLVLGEEPPIKPPEQIQDFTGHVTGPNSRGQIHCVTRWLVPTGKYNPVDTVILDRMDPIWRDKYGNQIWESEAQGEGLLVTGQTGDNHEADPDGIYAFRIQARNGAGDGPWSKIIAWRKRGQEMLLLEWKDGRFVDVYPEVSPPRPVTPPPPPPPPPLNEPKVAPAVKWWIYRTENLSKREEKRLHAAFQLLQAAHEPYVVRVTSDHAIAQHGGVTGSVIPRFFSADPAAEGWQAEPKENNGGLRWLRRKLKEG